MYLPKWLSFKNKQQDDVETQQDDVEKPLIVETKSLGGIGLVRKNKELSHCFLLYSVIERDYSSEEAQENIDDYNHAKSLNHKCVLIDKINGVRKYYDKTEEKETKLYEHVLRFASFNKYAYPAWCAIDEAIRHKMKAKEICKPICAAMEVGLIERPQWEDFIADFPDFIGNKGFSKTEFNKMLREKNYENDEVYKYYLEVFRKIKAETKS